LDCSVVRGGQQLLVFKSDPITFATEDIGYYLVRVNANDLATTGAQPRWLLVTILLPERQTKAKYVQRIAREIDAACREIGVAVIGGHTEITYGLHRPILVGTLVGEVESGGLVTPQGAHPGDSLLLTKGVPIEATAILAREFPERLAGALSADELGQARSFLDEPGISVLRDAKIALSTGKVTAMHDPTEGGLVTALWELAQASGRKLWFDPSAVPIPALAAQVCREFGLDPLRAISSGALLLAASKTTASKIRRALESEGIVCAEIGGVERGPRGIWAVSGSQRRRVKPPLRDEISRVFDLDSGGPRRFIAR
jgi:hydrogenase maturation factor